MSSHAGRNEYVLSEVGKVYAGTHNKIAGIDSVDVYWDSNSNKKFVANTNSTKHTIIVISIQGDLGFLDSIVILCCQLFVIF